MSQVYQHPLSRRHFLRSLAGVIALPFMPSLSWAQGNRAEAYGAAPRRFVSMVTGDGIHPDVWSYTKGSNGLSLSKALEPLAKLSDQVSIIEGLSHSRKMKRVHGYHFTSFLNCSHVDAENIKSNISIDQLIATRVGERTAIPSLVLGVEETRPGIVNGAPSIYQATNSWSTETTPVPPEIIPEQAYKRLFDSSGLLSDKSILDYVMDSTKSVRRKVSADDRDKLDEYLTSVRELEQRIQKNGTAGSNGWVPSLRVPNLPEPEEGMPEDKDAHMKMMLDILVLALQMDKTRVANFVLQQDFSNRTYEFINGVSKVGSHTLSHYNRKKGTKKDLEDYQRVNRYHLENVAYVAEKMSRIDEGNGTTLLDNTLIVFGSCYLDGNVHDRSKLPIALVGGRSHGLVQSDIMSFSSDRENALGNLHMTIGETMGVSTDEFAKGTRKHYGYFS
ncbi:MAG: DUF1552 domain-containing protein [Opitutales bacterium]